MQKYCDGVIVHLEMMKQQGVGDGSATGSNSNSDGAQSLIQMVCSREKHVRIEQ